MPDLVRIVGVTEVAPGAVAEGEAGQVAITYSADDVPPRTVFVDKGKDTQEERVRLIKEDLEAARAAGKEFLDIP